MTPAEILDRWHAAAASLLPPGSAIWDAHTHTGDNDPDGFSNTASDLLAALDRAGHAGAVVMTNQDPNGYDAANARVLAEAAASGGRLVPFARIDPRLDGAAGRAERALAAGHRGIKLHPRGESFSMDHPGVHAVCATAAARGVPVLVHSGRGIPPLGEAAISLVDGIPGLRLILAHCAISDLSRLGPVAAQHPGLYFDTAWWDTTDRLALVAWVPPGRILYASDTPYGSPLLGGILAVRTAIAAGYSDDQVGAVLGGTLRGLLSGDEPRDLGPAVGEEFLAQDAGLLRVYASLHGAIVATFGGTDATEPISLARLACHVADGVAHRDVYRAIAATLDAVATPADAGTARDVLLSLLVAADAALTPAVPVPDL